MTKSKSRLIAILLVSNLMALGFAAWAYAAKVAEAQNSRNFTPQGFEFGVTTPIFRYHFPREKHKATVFKGTWIAETVDEVKPDYVIDSAEIKPGALPVVVFDLSKPNNDWPRGLYRLEIRADGVLVHTVRFYVK